MTAEASGRRGLKGLVAAVDSVEGAIVQFDANADHGEAGHRALFEADENTDLSYSDLSGFGGIVVTSGANGSGTVKSRTGTSVDDTFSYIGYFVGSQDDDILNGADGDFWEGWDGAAGNDTINGGGGYDMLSYRWNGDTAITAIVTAAGAGTAVDGFGDTDTFTGIERIQGSRFGDLMRNDSAAGCEFQGDLGNDTIQGGSGDGDVLRLRVNRADAQVAVQGGAVIVTSAEGTDRLTGVETLRFDDGDQDISYLLADIVGTGEGETLTGVFSDLDEDGALLLKTGDSERRITAGDVFFASTD